MSEENPKPKKPVNPLSATGIMLLNIWRSRQSLYRNVVHLDEYSPYPLLTPHSKEDVEAVAAAAHESSGMLATQESGTHSDRRSSEKSYQFIDRGVSRAQGLLTFNSLVFAGITLFLQLHPAVWEKVILIVVTLPLVVSTVLSLLSTLVIWFDPKDHARRSVEAPRIWKIWAYRALMFNVSVFLSMISFVFLSGLILVKIIIVS